MKKQACGTPPQAFVLFIFIQIFFEQPIESVSTDISVKNHAPDLNSAYRKRLQRFQFPTLKAF